VDGLQDPVVKYGGLTHRTQLTPLNLGQHMLNALRHLKSRHQLATKHFQLALVQGVQVVVEGDHFRSDATNCLR
jgi:hypothetical protein